MRRTGRTRLVLGLTLLAAVGATACTATSADADAPAAAAPSNPLPAVPHLSDPPMPTGPKSLPGSAMPTGPESVSPVPRAEATRWYLGMLRSINTEHGLDRWSDGELLDLGDGFCAQLRKTGKVADGAKWLADHGVSTSKQGADIMVSASGSQSLCADQQRPFRAWMQSGASDAPWR